MSFEKLAIIGIVIFGFMALTQALRTVHEAKKLARRRTQKRPRRPVASEVVARQIAESLVQEVAGKYPKLCERAQKTSVIPKDLDVELSKAQLHFQDRVIPKFKGLFYLAINSVVLKK